MNWKKSLPLALCIGLLAGCSSFSKTAQEAPLPPLNERMMPYQNHITPDYLKSHLSIYASDEFAGRETGLRGQKLAVEYLVAQLKSLNVAPAGEDSTYLQPVAMTANQSDSTVYSFHHKNESGEWTEMHRTVSSLDSDAMVTTSWGGTAPNEGEIVFAGFGINDEAMGVMHLGEEDLSGKYVLAFSDIPNEVDGEQVISESINWRTRFGQVIQTKGAKGLLLITFEDFEELQANARQNYAKYSGLRLNYIEQQSRTNERSYNYIHADLAAQLLGTDDIKAMHEALMKDLKGFTPKALDVKMSMQSYNREVAIDSENVLGIVEGSDPALKDEVVILTAHLDHVGIGAPDETGDTIYNGADDDGSGSIGLLNVAKAVQEAAEAGHGPRRSILFLWVTGEEKGLLGSRYYSDHPIYSIENTVANINIDMIGRRDKKYDEKPAEDYAYIIGAEIISSQIDSVLKTANSMSGEITLDMQYNDLQDPNQFYRRSDHWNFGRFGIPFVFFFTGVHDDYHRPGDEAHKIEYEKMAKIARTIYTTAIMLANDDSRPTVDNQAFIDITKAQAR